jgi:signal peptidase I
LSGLFDKCGSDEALPGVQQTIASETMSNTTENNKAKPDRGQEEAGAKAAQPGPPKSVVREFFEQGVITFIMALFLMTFVAQAMGVPTGSMQNNINIGDYFFVNKFIFGLPTPIIGRLLPAREIRRGDVIVFKYPPDPKVNYVKRVIGLPGDEVSVRGRQVLINGQALPEQHVMVKIAGSESASALPEISVEPAPPGASYKVYYDQTRSSMGEEYERQSAKYAVSSPIVVPPNSFFVMGDSRDNSLDSRYWGFVPRANVIGHPLYVHWSINPPTPGSGSGNFFSRINWRRTGHAIK